MDTPAPIPIPATCPGFFRRLFSWKRVRKVLFVLAALITLAALLLAEEDWRGSRAWANYKRAMEAKGERFDAARLIPPKVPDDQNFAMTPLFAPLFDLPPEVLRQPIAYQRDTNFPLSKVTNSDTGQKVVFYVTIQRVTNILTEFRLPYWPNWTNRFTWYWGLAGDLIPCAKAFEKTNSAALVANLDDPVKAAAIILDHLKPLETVLAELQSASARPFSRFNIPYEECANPQVSTALLQHLSQAKQLCQILTLHAEAEMVVGNSDQALKDILLMFRLDDGIKDEPPLISQLVRYACLTIMLQSVGEGLAEQRWSEAQLRVLQERLQKTDLLAATIQALYGERDLYFNPMFDRSRMFPRGWSRLEQLNFNRAFQELGLRGINITSREINPSVNRTLELAGQKLSAEGPLHALFHHTLMTRDRIPNMLKVAQKTAFAQSGVDMTMLACALERYRLAQGQYPEELNALAPGFVSALPHDIINGQPLKYRRADNGRFLLYSVGWNEKDDGGVVATQGNPPHQDREQGDWGWQYPEKP